MRMPCRWFPLLLVGAGLASNLFAGAPDTPAAAGPRQGSDSSTATPGQTLDEFVVRGTRMYELRAAIVEAEDRFFELYNELNEVDDFRIGCTKVAVTGTKLTERYCRTRMEDRAESDEARSFLESVQDGLAQPRGLDAKSMLMLRDPDYRQNFVKLLKDHPELLERAKEVEAAMTRYDRERIKRAKGHVISWQ